MLKLTIHGKLVNSYFAQVKNVRNVSFKETYQLWVQINEGIERIKYNEAGSGLIIEWHIWRGKQLNKDLHLIRSNSSIQQSTLYIGIYIVGDD